MYEVKSDEIKSAEAALRLVRIIDEVLIFAYKHGFIAGEDMSVLIEHLGPSVTEEELCGILNYLIGQKKLTIGIRKRQFLHLLPT